jgi:hypothetical protein
MTITGVMGQPSASITPVHASGAVPDERDHTGERATLASSARRRLEALPRACDDPVGRALMFLQFLMGGYPADDPLTCEVRAIRPDQSGESDGRVLRRWFGLEVEYLERAARWCIEIAGEYDVYVGVLPRSGKGGFARDVRQARMLWADVDAGNDPSGVFDLLKASGLLPHMVAMVVTASGGAHVYWPLRDTHSLADNGRRCAYRDLLKRVVTAIGGRKPGPHADGNAAEEARVLRVPGTLYHKRVPPTPVDAAYVPGVERHEARWWGETLPMLPVGQGGQGGRVGLAGRKGLPHSGRVFGNDEDLITAACRASAEFGALMSGDLGHYDGDESRADMALMMRLAWWTDRDPARMERVFGRSMLARREKWRRADYRRRTIERALAAM